MEEKIENFLEPSYLCQSDDSEIKKLAETITKDKKGEEEKAKAIFEWVRENVMYDIIPLVGAKDVLKRKPMAGMCFDKANLFIALCRSVGIPARYFIMDAELKVKRKDISPRSKKHAAAEVFINNKWIVADPTFEKSIKNLIETSEFGNPTWTKLYKVERKRSLSKVLVFLINTILIHIPFMKKLRQAIREARTE